MEIVKKSKAAKNKAIKVLLAGGVVVCPTDTVYGFLALSSNKKAVEKIYKIKKRAKSKPLAIFVKDLKMAKELAEIDKNQEKIIKKKWPGKYTFVLKSKNGTVALRIPKNKFLNDLLKKINKPLVQTSVNLSGKPVLTKISDIIKQFDKSDILIIDGGNVKNNKSSKIIDLTNNKIKILRR